MAIPLGAEGGRTIFSTAFQTGAGAVGCSRLSGLGIFQLGSFEPTAAG